MNIQTPLVCTTVGTNDKIWMQGEHIRLSEKFFIKICAKLSSAAPTLTGNQFIKKFILTEKCWDIFLSTPRKRLNFCTGGGESQEQACPDTTF